MTMYIHDPGGRITRLCSGRNEARYACHVCRSTEDVRMCDAYREDGRNTCDATVCPDHSRRFDGAVDVCAVCDAKWNGRIPVRRPQ